MVDGGKDNDKHEPGDDGADDETPSPSGDGVAAPETDAAHEGSAEPPETPELSAEALEEQLRSDLPQVRDPRVVRRGDGWFLLGSVERGGARRARARAEVARWGAKKGIVLLPVLFAPGEARHLERFGGLAKVLSPLLGAEDLSGHVEAHAAHSAHPRTLRRAARRLCRDGLAYLELVGRGVFVPRRLAAAACTQVLEDAFRLLFAAEGRRFVGAPEDITYFEEELAPKTPLRRPDVLLYFEAKGLAEQTRQHGLLAPKLPVGAFGLGGLVRRTGAFLRRLDRHFVDRFSTEASRVRRKRLRLVGIAAAILAGLGVVVGMYVFTRPLAPIHDTDLVQNPGGIVGQYYAGERFEKHVLRRTDKNISFHFRGGSPKKGLPADRFSIRWVGFLRFSEPGRQKVCVDVDNGAKVYVSDRLIVDAWALDEPGTRCGTVRVIPGWYPLKIEYHEARGNARVRLSTGKTRNSARIVPATNLCCRQ